MNAEQLLQHFERISEAPDSIPRLRRFILDLAVRGKLVEQDPSDEPAEEQLERIIQAKVLLGRKKRAIEKKLMEVSDEARDYPLSAGWATSPLADLVTILNGRAYKQSELLNAGTPVLRVGNLFTSNKWYYSSLELEEDKYCDDGDLIFAWSASFGPFIWNGGHVIYHYHIWKLPLHSPADLSRDYLYLYLLNKTAEIKAAGHGISIVHMTKEKMERLDVPLPPLAEQHRIVAKVDDLMSLCDQLEAAKAERDKCRDSLVAASLQGLNQPTEEEETFREHARFTFNNLPRITTRAAHIKQLRQAILNLAVRGRLVEQDPSDEPAKELLKRIEAEKEILLNEGMIRKSKPLDTVQANELPFEAPWQWAWTRIGNAVLFTQYGTSQKSQPSASGVSVLAMGNIQDGSVIWGNEKRIPQASSELPELYLRKFDLLYNRTNSAELVGKTGIFLGEDNAMTFASYLIRLRPSLAWSNPRFINMAMNTSEFRATQIVPLIKKQTGQANVNGTALKNMLIPLPPLAEQHLIVAKVDELMAICDQLEAQITATEQDSRRFLESVLADALASGIDLSAEAQVA